MRPGALPAQLLSIGATAVILSGCGGSTTPAPSLSTPVPPLTRTAPPQVVTRPVRVTPTGPPVGATQTTLADGSHLTVTIIALIDPLKGSGAALLPGTRAVGLQVRIANAGPEIYDSSATGDFSVVASSGGVVPVFAPHGICETPLEDFDRYMLPGQVRSGCVAFSVPDGGRVMAVRFSPHAQAVGRLTWAAGRDDD